MHLLGQLPGRSKGSGEGISTYARCHRDGGPPHSYFPLPLPHCILFQRIICQVEGICLTTPVGQVSDLTPETSSSTRNEKKVEETRKIIARGLLS